MNYQPYQIEQPKQNPGIFTTFISGKQSVQNYLVPAGGMAILIDLDGKKMYFKSVNVNGVPAPVRTFDIKEKPLPLPEGVNVVTRSEFEDLSKKFDMILDTLTKKEGTDNESNSQ